MDENTACIHFVIDRGTLDNVNDKELLYDTIENTDYFKDKRIDLSLKRLFWSKDLLLKFDKIHNLYCYQKHFDIRSKIDMEVTRLDIKLTPEHYESFTKHTFPTNI